VTTTVTTGTLRTPDGVLHHEVRGSGPLLALVGSPMGADAFAPAAELLAADRTVLTTDPRGIGRSPLHDPEQESTPQLRAEDLARLVTHLDAGPADVLGSSGGAVTALALAQARPDLVRTVIAHEPPLEELLPDREQLRAHLDDMIALYAAGDALGAWQRFLDAGNIPVPAEVMVAREPQQRADERRWFLHEMRATVAFVPDAGALRALGDRVVVGIGEDSAGEVCDRTSRALAEMLGVAPVLFPGGHIGFVDDPAAFVRRLREVLGARADGVRS
jgi:pimeloyl-ACP methyl ester carboxylesterase